MKKAAIVFAHQLPNQLNVLLAQLLADGETDVYVHVNKLNEGIIPEIMKNEHVFITKKNLEYHWGDDAILKAALLLFREILETRICYEYVMLLSGQDLMVRTGLNEFLEEHRGEIFIQYDANDPERNNNLCKYFLLYKWPSKFKERYDEEIRDDKSRIN